MAFASFSQRAALCTKLNRRSHFPCNIFSLLLVEGIAQFGGINAVVARGILSNKFMGFRSARN
jgi:hypothetical protein